MKIKGIDLRAMSNDESFQFHTTIMGYYEKANYIETSAPESLYFSAIRNFDDALKQIRESDKTNPLAKLDKQRDHLYTGIVKIVDAHHLHIDPEVVEAARLITVLLHGYGNPVRKKYNEATSLYYNLSQEFVLPKYAPLIEKLGLAEWTVLLKKANEDFESLFNERNDEKSVLIARSVRESRQEVEKYYRLLITVTESELMIKPNCPLEEYVDKINELIAYYKRSIAANKTYNKKKKDKNKDEEDNSDKNDNNNPDDGPIEI